LFGHSMFGQLMISSMCSLVIFVSQFLQIQNVLVKINFLKIYRYTLFRNGFDVMTFVFFFRKQNKRKL